VGIRIAERVAPRMAKVQLELGGKNPAIVLECEDLDGAAQEIVAAAFLCSGQRCTALSRVIVEESQADPLLEQLKIHMAKIRVGNGLDPETTMGPLVSQGQMETVAGYVRKGLEDGATLVVGGRPLAEDPGAEGYFYAPTLFDHVSSNSALALEEIFGPVLPLVRSRQ
jgi:acyl-CoA reductase-like NAD-dependent aldehyde dehydrogenase